MFFERQRTVSKTSGRPKNIWKGVSKGPLAEEEFTRGGGSICYRSGICRFGSTSSLHSSAVEKDTTNTMEIFIFTDITNVVDIIRGQYELKRKRFI